MILRNISNSSARAERARYKVHHLKEEVDFRKVNLIKSTLMKSGLDDSRARAELAESKEALAHAIQQLDTELELLSVLDNASKAVKVLLTGVVQGDMPERPENLFIFDLSISSLPLDKRYRRNVRFDGRYAIEKKIQVFGRTYLRCCTLPSCRAYQGC
ncbi:uncharacterized protein LY89DRAFT_160236 [Mollisia scopiformis]|uniref:Uncharacterized protein n=1 Tax=Mollisia scopiformis TaxID=149040 RepID=A0A194X142_MOLSC|nr:uncharacterized protein LY89DRAFT_160236 [Mollisia scopiformis]KUJ13582.1 hypothetical protein LY89DRAFT_160236 [Mollisia scopiformis]